MGDWRNLHYCTLFLKLISNFSSSWQFIAWNFGEDHDWETNSEKITIEKSSVQAQYKTSRKVGKSTVSIENRANKVTAKCNAYILLLLCRTRSGRYTIEQRINPPAHSKTRRNLASSQARHRQVQYSSISFVLSDLFFVQHTLLLN